jgi:hypothetical protein
MNYNFKVTSNPLAFGLALLAGTGLILMILALMAGVLVVETTGNLLLFVFLGGLVLLILGIVSWAVVFKPYAHFDDINQPLEDDHGHGHSAIVPHEESAAPSAASTHPSTH